MVFMGIAEQQPTRNHIHRGLFLMSSRNIFKTVTVTFPVVVGIELFSEMRIKKQRCVTVNRFRSELIE